MIHEEAFRISNLGQDLMGHLTIKWEKNARKIPASPRA